MMYREAAVQAAHALSCLPLSSSSSARRESCVAFDCGDRARDGVSLAASQAILVGIVELRSALL